MSECRAGRRTDACREWAREGSQRSESSIDIDDPRGEQAVNEIRQRGNVLT
jgi:hypothetical protein